MTSHVPHRRPSHAWRAAAAVVVLAAAGTASAQNLAYQDFANSAYDATGRGYVRTFETAGDLADFTSSNGTASWVAPSAGTPGYVTVPNGTHLTSDDWAGWSDAKFPLNATSDYTVEFRLRVSGTANQGVASYSMPGSPSTAIGGVSFLKDGDDLKVYYGIDTATTATPRGTLRGTVPWSSQTYDFHTVRIAAEYDASVTGKYLYTLFVDGQRAGTNLTQSRTGAAVDRLIFGDLGTNGQGQVDLDYVAFRVG